MGFVHGAGKWHCGFGIFNLTLGPLVSGILSSAPLTLNIYLYMYTGPAGSIAAMSV